MAEISWIKLKTAMFDDEKVKMIESKGFYYLGELVE